jgi:Protein of unknown function (DUF2997)
MKTIRVRIRKDGSIEAETHGLKGAACLPWINALEELTDARTVDSRYTEEFYEAAEEAAGTAQSQEQEESQG